MPVVLPKPRTALSPSCSSGDDIYTQGKWLQYNLQRDIKQLQDWLGCRLDGLAHDIMWVWVWVWCGGRRPAGLEPAHVLSLQVPAAQRSHLLLPCMLCVASLQVQAGPAHEGGQAGWVHPAGKQQPQHPSETCACLPQAAAAHPTSLPQTHLVHLLSSPLTLLTAAPRLYTYSPHPPLHAESFNAAIRAIQRRVRVAGRKPVHGVSCRALMLAQHAAWAFLLMYCTQPEPTLPA